MNKKKSENKEEGRNWGGGRGIPAESLETEERNKPKAKNSTKRKGRGQ